MYTHVPILQLVTLAAFALATVLWVVGLLRIRRHRGQSAVPRRAGTLGALPGQRRSGPQWDSVELTAAERDAFANLVRRLSDGHWPGRGHSER
jgi:hypothetical protein